MVIILKLLQLHKNYLGLPGTSGVFEKYLEALENILELLQLQIKYLGPLGTPGVFEKYLEALTNNLKLAKVVNSREVREVLDGTTCFCDKKLSKFG